MHSIHTCYPIAGWLQLVTNDHNTPSSIRWYVEHGYRHTFNRPNANRPEPDAGVKSTYSTKRATEKRDYMAEYPSDMRRQHRRGRLVFVEDRQFYALSSLLSCCACVLGDLSIFFLRSIPRHEESNAINSTHTNLSKKSLNV